MNHSEIVSYLWGIAELNERFDVDLGPEHRVTIEQMMEKLDGDAALEAAARVSTRSAR